VTSEITMPRLDGIARAHVDFRRFIVHQRQTNRGEYALLCGDLPTLSSGSPKMSDVAGYAEGRVDCLPWALRDQGYLTAYLQSAPLEFMSKDRFMRLVGFERLHGREWFQRAYRMGAWGPDDRAFFERGLDLIDELNDQSRPWFATLLTVGTHHPYTIPRDFESRYERGSFAAAIDYLDRAVGEFYDGLVERGVLDDTIVLLTSDEAFVPKQHGSGLDALLGQTWAPLVAAVPGADRRTIDQPYAHVDVARSVLDAIGAAEAAGGFGGRSLFRRYDEPRSLPFGNVHLHQVGALLPDGELVTCRDDLSGCRRYRSTDGRVFAADELEPTEQPATAEQRRWIEDVVRRSLTIRVARAQGRYFRLADAPRLVLDQLASERIFGGQFLTVPPRTRIEVELVVRNTGHGRTRLMHFLWHPDGTLFSRKLRMQPGDTAVLRYGYRAADGLEKLTCNLKLDGRRAPRDGAVLEIDTARLELVPVPDAEGPLESGVDLHEFRVFGPPAPDAGPDGGR
jgi:hypothetical protein